MSQSYADGNLTNGSVEFFVFVLRATDPDEEVSATFALREPSL